MWLDSSAWKIVIFAARLELMEGKSIYRTGEGVMSQMSLAYSCMVRSLLKKWDPEVFMMDILVQFCNTFTKAYINSWFGYIPSLSSNWTIMLTIMFLQLLQGIRFLDAILMILKSINTSFHECSDAYLLVLVGLVNLLLALNVSREIMSNQKVICLTIAFVAFQGSQELTVIIISKNSASDELLHLHKWGMRHKLFPISPHSFYG